MSVDGIPDEYAGCCERCTRRVCCCNCCQRFLHWYCNLLCNTCWGVARDISRSEECYGWYGMIMYLGIRGRKCSKKRQRGSCLPYCATHRNQWLMYFLRFIFILVNYFVIEYCVAYAVENASMKYEDRFLSQAGLALGSAVVVTMTSSMFEYITSYVLDTARVSGKKYLDREAEEAAAMGESDDDSSLEADDGGEYQYGESEYEDNDIAEDDYVPKGSKAKRA